MVERIKQLFEGKTSVSDLGLLAALVIGALILVFVFYIIVKACRSVEEMSGRPAHTLIKTIIIAAIPTVCGVLELLGIDIGIPHKIIWACVIGTCVLVAVWNLKVYGPIGGIMFTIMHIVFGIVASLGVLSLVFVAIFVIAVYFFGSGGIDGSSASGSSSVPSTVTNVATNERYHVTKGVNGESYIYLNGNSVILRPGAFAGRFIDDYGNEYK